MNYELTEHARKRKRQRGISDRAMEIIVHYGRHERAPGGAIKIIFGDKECREYTALRENYPQLLDKVKGATVIVDGKWIITIYKGTPKYKK
jgi:hypothetical protein